ncbi:MAG: hypothetical protein N4A50_08320 [Vallitalea sp.]|nr:hypothetical protein [Vallitalea sp.]
MKIIQKSKKIALIFMLNILLFGFSFSFMTEASNATNNINHSENHSFYLADGDEETAAMNIMGNIDISSDRRTITIHYDIKTQWTNNFGCFIRPYYDGYMKGQFCYASTSMYRYEWGDELVYDDSWSPNLNGSKTYTFPKPLEEIHVGYYMNLYPTNSISSRISIVPDYVYKIIKLK